MYMLAPVLCFLNMFAAHRAPDLRLHARFMYRKDDGKFIFIRTAYMWFSPQRTRRKPTVRNGNLHIEILRFCQDPNRQLSSTLIFVIITCQLSHIVAAVLNNYFLTNLCVIVEILNQSSMILLNLYLFIYLYFQHNFFNPVFGYENQISHI